MTSQARILRVILSSSSVGCVERAAETEIHARSNGKEEEVDGNGNGGCRRGRKSRLQTKGGKMAERKTEKERSLRSIHGVRAIRFRQAALLVSSDS